MRFYNSDGSIRCEDDDVDFGWSFDWVGEKTETSKIANDDDQIVSKQTKDCTEEDNKEDYSQYNLEMKHKEELTDFLMRMDNPESLLLVSIVSSGFYKILADSHETTRLKNPGQTDFDLALRLNRRERLEKLRSVFGKAELNQLGLEDDLERREGFERIGLNGDIDETLGDFLEKTCQVHIEVGKIGKCFQETDVKLTEIQKEASEFRRDLCETKFLDDVLHLLEEDFEKVGGRMPFRNVGKNAGRTEEVNLII